MRVISIALTIIIVALFFYFNSHELLAIRIMDWRLLCASSVFIFLFFYFNGVLNNTCFRMYGVNLKFTEWFGLSVLNSFLNIVAPFKGGAIATSIYLKKKHSFSYSSFISIMAASTLLIVMANLFLAIGLLLMRPALLSPEQTQIALYVTAFLFGIGLIFAYFAPVTPASKNRLLHLIHEVLSAWRLIRSFPKELFKLSLACLGMIFTLAATTYLTVASIGVDVSFEAALAIGVFTNLSSILTITPSNIGIKEALASIGAASYGIDIVDVVAASLIERLSLLLVSSVTSVYFYRTLVAGDRIRSKVTSLPTGDSG